MGKNDPVGTVLYEKVIFQNEEKDFQIRLTVTEFRGVQYLNVRKYFLSFEEDYLPTREGVTLPLSIMPVYNMFEGLYDILSYAEADELRNEIREKAGLEKEDGMARIERIPF